MTPDLSIPRPMFDFPFVTPAPLPQLRRDGAMLALWQGNRHLSVAGRDALLDRYATNFPDLPSPTGSASEAGDQRHLLRVVSSGRQPAIPPS